MSNPKNHGTPWTASDDRQLKQLADQNTPTRLIGLKMGRTPEAVQSHASDAKVSLKPTNQSPYGTRGK
ncbi:MAG: SANT/Myb domain-containing protein [Propionibacteriaceae bacterium]|nr:SANT/Myb domain-containing protein [Propionibacteriaceae bacterium]